MRNRLSPTRSRRGFTAKMTDAPAAVRSRSRPMQSVGGDRELKSSESPSFRSTTIETSPPFARHRDHQSDTDHDTFTTTVSYPPRTPSNVPLPGTVRGVWRGRLRLGVQAVPPQVLRGFTPTGTEDRNAQADLRRSTGLLSTG